MSPATYRIAIVPGDGIGPEVMAEAVKVLRLVESLLKESRFELVELSIGAGEYLRSGEAIPPGTLDRMRQCSAILLGAVGIPEVRLPDGTEITSQIDLREQLDLYAGVRPVYLFHAHDSPLKRCRAGSIDLVIVRENTEGLFSSRKRPRRPAADVVEDVMHISRKNSARLFHYAFRLARTRRGEVTLVDKANVLPSMAFFRSVFDEVASQYPDVRTRRIYVDAAALYLIQAPQRFDVIVTENIFGDILSDLAAALVGGMGVAPSADIGDRHAVFQPAHGSAPDIAGQARANPTAMILSVGMMLEWLGTPELVRAGQWVRDGVRWVYGNPVNRTPDLGGCLSTAQMGDLICEAVERVARGDWDAA